MIPTLLMLLVFFILMLPEPPNHNYPGTKYREPKD